MLLQFIAIFSVFLRGWVSSNLFEVIVLHITLSRETSANDKSPVMFVLATVHCKKNPINKMLEGQKYLS